MKHKPIFSSINVCILIIINNKFCRNRNRNQGGGGGLDITGPENRRRFQSGGGGAAPRRDGRPISSQGRPLPPQDFDLPDGALPHNRPIIN